jgi:hypothetical protein
MSTVALLAIHSHQAAEQLEEELTDHLERHKPRVWLPALMEARGEISRKDDLIAELRRVIDVRTKQLDQAELRAMEK